ncbi:MAG: TIGR02808 family protein [Aeromonas sp.]
MSTFETVIWTILGYSALPMILLSGCAGVAIATAWLFNQLGWGQEA